MKTIKTAKSIKPTKPEGKVVASGKLTSGEKRQKIKDFLKVQKEYIQHYRQRMFDALRLKQIESEIEKMSKDETYTTKINWEGMPYNKAQLILFHDEVAMQYNYHLEEELNSRVKLLNDYGASEEEVNNLINVVRNKDLIKEPKKYPSEEKPADYFG